VVKCYILTSRLSIGIIEQDQMGTVESGNKCFVKDNTLYKHIILHIIAVLGANYAINCFRVWLL